MNPNQHRTIHLESTNLSVPNVFCQHIHFAEQVRPGYKEFHNYLSLPYPTQEQFVEAVENMKTSTRQYAKRQTSWLRNKLLPILYAANKCGNSDGHTGPSTFTYLLDATGLPEPICHLYSYLTFVSQS